MTCPDAIAKGQASQKSILSSQDGLRHHKYSPSGITLAAAMLERS